MEDDKSLEKLNEWYFKYSDDLYRYVLMMTVDQELAKDVIQDTFIKAYKNFEGFRGAASEKNWLYRIAYNTTIDELRKRKPLRFMFDNYNYLVSNDYVPEKVTQLGEVEAQLYRSLQKLKRSYREVIILRKIEELSIRETAEVLNWTIPKVKTTLLRALEALKKQMIKEGYEHESI
ncbi:RNA polymerase sigma factor [Litchfieldia salsa]|uniref:RNA polymerase sigma-70 factor, ECF subfamily n=1 Tax=Litchfieldia salsa TaxID=930152 RepID=A0A1H0SZ63_9BACI|nr:RNA polymerase sigma factor [Litchfieldia salsa]SDP46840.1 RNA polymerase sigma-70 factor, ECF subfamily [Litchfieldia salsa]